MARPSSPRPPRVGSGSSKVGPPPPVKGMSDPSNMPAMGGPPPPLGGPPPGPMGLFAAGAPPAAPPGGGGMFKPSKAPSAPKGKGGKR